jgi:diguanylate cyclase (GGDEF)-like protein/PAS domain S-box-containing protein
MLKIVLIINDLIEKAKIKAYLNIANNTQNYYRFKISAEFNNSDNAVNYLYENKDIDIMILENSASGTFSGIDLILLAEEKFPKLNSILICEDGDELHLAENRINNLSAVLSKITTSDTFVNSLFMTAVKQQKLKENIEEEQRKLNDYREIIDHTHDAIFLLEVDQDENIYYRRINKTNQQRTSLSSDQVIGKTPTEIYGEELGAKFLKNYLKCIKEKKRLKYREKISFKTGDIVAETILYPIIENDKAIKIIGTSLDITEHYKTEQKLNHQKTHDKETNLHNRDCFIDKLNNLNNNNELPLSVILLELDSYNIYKNLFGFQNANRLLSRVVKFLNYTAGRNNFLARIGESRFAVLIQSRRHKALSTFKKLMNKFEKLTIDSLEFDFSAKLFELLEKKDNIENYYDYINEKLNAINFENKFSSTSVFYNSLIKELKKESSGDVQHSDNLAALVHKTADYFEIKENQKRKLILLAELHDTGKIFIDSRILKKGKKLTKKDWVEYLIHVEKSAAFAGEYHDLSSIYNLIYHHHEHYNGNGYPDGLQGKEIPYLARLFRVINFYDMLSSNSFYPFLKDKYYFAKLDDKEISLELENYKGIVFDPEITDKFMEMLKS